MQQKSRCQPLQPSDCPDSECKLGKALEPPPRRGFNNQARGRDSLGLRACSRYGPLALSSLLLAALTAAAADTPKGTVLYSCKEGQRVVLHTINADGSGDSVLPGQTAPVNLFPIWSPDGKRIAFMSGGPGGFKVTLINRDGTGLRTLETGSRLAGMPAWSPDGKQLVFVSGGETPVVYVADADGNGMKQVSPAGTGGIAPFWMADGKRVGYTRIGEQDKGEIVLAAVDGSSEEALTQTGKIAVAGPAALSPDGKRLLYLLVEAGKRRATLTLLDFANKTETSVLPEIDVAYVGEPFFIPAPAWSPDGKSALLPIVTDKGRGLFRISLDGQMKTRLTPDGVDCFSGVWSASE